MRRPAFLDPLVRILLGDNIHEPSASDIIGDEMTARPDPLSVAIGLEHLRRHFVRIEKRPPDHLTRVSWVVIAIERFAHDRFHTVPADQIFRLDASPIRERKDDAVAMLLQPYESVSEMNRAAIKPACQSVEQVSAVKRE